MLTHIYRHANTIMASFVLDPAFAYSACSEARESVTRHGDYCPRIRWISAEIGAGTDFVSKLLQKLRSTFGVAPTTYGPGAKVPLYVNALTASASRGDDYV
jgi:hypothetical protein